MFNRTARAATALDRLRNRGRRSGRARHRIGRRASTAAPVNTKLPSISGSPIVGKDLTGDHGNWTGSGITYANRWIRCDKNVANCAPITGATGTHYTLTSADFGATIRFEVTARTRTDRPIANSAPTAEITNGTGVPASSSPPTIAGARRSARRSPRATALGRRPADHVLVPVAALRQERQRLQEHRRRDARDLQARPGATSASRSGSRSRPRTPAASRARARYRRRSCTDAAGGGGGGIINLPGGGKSIDVTDVPKGERLIVDKVTFSPNPVTSRSQLRSRSRSPSRTRVATSCGTRSSSSARRRS